MGAGVEQQVLNRTERSLREQREIRSRRFQLGGYRLAWVLLEVHRLASFLLFGQFMKLFFFVTETARKSARVFTPLKLYYLG